MNINRQTRKVNIEDMDGILLERCRPLFIAKSEDEREAAMEEFVQAVKAMIDIDGGNAYHRYDVTEQAVATLDSLVNSYGRDRSIYANQETKMYMTLIFHKRLIERLLDEKYGNSMRHEQPGVTSMRNKIRSGFQAILRLNENTIEADKGVLKPKNLETEKIEEPVNEHELFMERMKELREAFERKHSNVKKKKE